MFRLVLLQKTALTLVQQNDWRPKFSVCTAYAQHKGIWPMGQVDLLLHPMLHINKLEDPESAEKRHSFRIQHRASDFSNWSHDSEFNISKSKNTSHWQQQAKATCSPQGAPQPGPLHWGYQPCSSVWSSRCLFQIVVVWITLQIYHPSNYLWHLQQDNL